MSMCNAMMAYDYYRKLLTDTIDCFDPNVEEKLRNVVNNGPEVEEPDNSELDYVAYDKLEPIGVLNVSLLKADGSDTGYGSGVNWGIRKNGTKRNTNQSYIPYNSQDRVEGFFPLKSSPDERNNPMFKVITKDFGAFHVRVAQQGNKGLQSVESNAILGEWIRKRIGAPSGGYITKQMLEHYGKTYVTFRKYPDGTYLLDF